MCTRKTGRITEVNKRITSADRCTKKVMRGVKKTYNSPNKNNCKVKETMTELIKEKDN